MAYNLNFLIAALLLLLIIWFHFINSRRMHDYNGRTFFLFLMLGLFDILFDFLTTVLISDNRPDLRGMTLLLLTVFYLLQVLVPYSLFLYTWFLCEQTTKWEKIFYRVSVLPAICMGGIVLRNTGNGVLFRIDGAGAYIRGPLYLSMYLYAIFYGVIILICSICRHRKLGAVKLGIILEFLFILGGCVSIQALRNDLLMTGFGLGLGILVLYLTINNPSDYTDRLTGVFNMRSFTGHMRRLYEQKKNFHIIVVDLIQLRRFNMLFGSSFGDSLLKRVAKELQTIMNTDYVFRLSGRRFALLLSSLEEYERVRERIMYFFREALELGDEKVRASAVVCGMAQAQKLDDQDMLIAYIDYLVSQAPPSMETVLLQSDENTMKSYLDRKEIERYLGVAIEQDLFEICYQPVYSAEKQCFVAVEALSRLKHPTLGMVSPDVFIRIAEQNGQIVQIGQLQFKRVCRFVKEHPVLQKKLESIKFNLSPAEILREGCSRRLVATIQEFGLPYSFFQFEITETLATEYSDRLYQVVEDFHACGIELVLDDFGSGYANLDTVLKLSFSTIKLDRSLLNGIMEDEKARMFYQSIVEMMKNMGYRLIAEGVEHKKETELLFSWGVDMIQGYYFSKPLYPEELLLKLG